MPIFRTFQNASHWRLLRLHTVNNGTDNLVDLSGLGGICRCEACANGREEVLLDGLESTSSDGGLAKSPKASSGKGAKSRASAI
jgi:hypothetical protein